MRCRKLVLCLCMVLFSAVMATAQDGDENKNKLSETKEVSAVMATPQDENENMKKLSEAKELSGMSILGNDEAPKSLYIVPWKSSEISGETNLDTMLNEGDVPVDRDVFKRQIEFYQVSTAK